MLRPILKGFKVVANRGALAICKSWLPITGKLIKLPKSSTIKTSNYYEKLEHTLYISWPVYRPWDGGGVGNGGGGG